MEKFTSTAKLLAKKWAPYWPNSSGEPYASHINNTPKYVVSATLEEVEWGNWDNVSLIKGKLAEQIARLKQQPGKKIGVAGSPALVRSLLQDDLIDEFSVMIHTVIVGRGKRLFEGQDDLKRMRLVDSQVIATGVANLTYRPRRNG